MFGQWCEPLPEWAVVEVPGEVVVVGAVVVVVVDEVDVAALAIAAPPPASAPHTASVASSLRIMAFTSFLLLMRTRSLPALSEP